MWFATKSIDIILIYYFWFVISWKSRRKCVINKNNKVTQQSNKYEIWYHSLFNLMFILLRCSNINVFKTILHTINTLPQEKLKTTKHVFFLRSTFEFHRTPPKHCSINRIISVAFTVTYVWIIEEKQRKHTNLWKHYWRLIDLLLWFMEWINKTEILKLTFVKNVYFTETRVARHS